jgi:hypothetical protein
VTTKKVKRPVDTPEAIDKVIADFKAAADNMGGVADKLGGLGGGLLKGWYGAAEDMTAREISAVGAFCTKMATSFGQVRDAFVAYRAELVTVDGELDALQRTFDSEPDILQFPNTFPTTRPSSPAPSSTTLTLPRFPSLLTDPADPYLFLDPRNTAILKKLEGPALKAKTAIVAASELIAKGTDAAQIDVQIGAYLPFQRPFPRVPGPKAHASVLRTDVNDENGSPGVVELQELLQARGWNIQLTGKYDAQTARTVRQFQRNKGIRPVTGKVDQKTWDAIWTRRIVW